MSDKLWIKTYPPKGIKEHIMNMGFFNKVLPIIWDIKEEE
tara:strand:- start:167 stop:286 length:120 start_codon:yes stop_codon:yes gene_type:complete